MKEMAKKRTIPKDIRHQCGVSYKAIEAFNKQKEELQEKIKQIEVVKLTQKEVKEDYKKLSRLEQIQKQDEIKRFNDFCYKTNAQLQKLKSKLEFLEIIEISQKTLDNIVLDFFNDGVDMVTTTAESMSIPHVGTITAKTLFNEDYVKDTKLITMKLNNLIDWKETHSKKKRILEEGKIPKLNYRDEDGNYLGDNGGEDYLVHRDIEKFHILKFANINRTANIKLAFSAVRKRNFQRFVADNPDIAHKYTFKNY